MLFVSKEFIFGFLPVVLIGFYSIKVSLGATRAFAWLFASSLAFYGYNYPPYVLLILASYGVNYLGARRLQATGSRALLIALIVLNVAYLGYFKYSNFFIENINAALGLHMQNDPIALPLGISFYTFQQIPYLVGAYRREFKDLTLLKYCVVNSFFPHLIAGPIIWHREIAPQLDRLIWTRFDPADFARGLAFFAGGLFKKIVFADNLAYMVDEIFGAAQSGQVLTFADAWLGSLAYGLQLYFDFAGYSEMAIGLALLFGIHFPINFYSPYKATSLIEFWRRWHMTMTRFFQEFVYVPLQLAIARHADLPALRYAAILLMMFLVGVWHGAGWTWFLWGLVHGALLVLNHLWRKARAAAGVPPVADGGAVGRLAGWALTMLTVTACWVLFRAHDFSSARIFYEAMFFVRDGVVLPEVLTVILGERATALALWAGIELRGGWLSPALAARITEFQVWSVLVLTAFVAVVPNSIEVMGYFTSNRGRQSFRVRPESLVAVSPAFFRWRPSAVWIGSSAVLFVAALTSVFDDSAKTVFIYFNF